jgi:hypothetical protein
MALMRIRHSPSETEEPIVVVVPEMTFSGRQVSVGDTEWQ